MRNLNIYELAAIGAGMSSALVTGRYASAPDLNRVTRESLEAETKAMFEHGNLPPEIAEIVAHIGEEQASAMMVRGALISVKALLVKSFDDDDHGPDCDCQREWN